MSLVTSQGMKARDEYSRQADEVRVALRELLSTAGPIHVAQIIEHFEPQPEDLVREAMWRLIDDNEAEIAPSRQLRLAGH